MRLYDKELAEIVDSNTRVEIARENYYLRSNPSGSCDGCAFIKEKTCPSRATGYCTSNGGIIITKEKPEWV